MAKARPYVKNCVVTVTSIDTGKVINCAIMSKHCVCPNKLKMEHEKNCSANYTGPSGGMEVAGVKKNFNNQKNYITYGM